jgi:hypothetical protein
VETGEVFLGPVASADIMHGMRLHPSSFPMSPNRVAPFFASSMSILLAISTLPGTAAAVSKAQASLAATTSVGEVDPRLELEPAPPLTGVEIYERVLANRHNAYFQRQELVSGDAGGSFYKTELWTRWKDARDKNGKVRRKTLSKTLAKYTSPNDVRGSGYLIIQKLNAPNDSFVYFPSMRRVRRVRLDQAIMGTDYSIEDIVPRELETAEYVRAPDEAYEGVDCYVVELIPKPGSGSQFSRLQAFVEKEHYVAVRTRYWDLDELEVKEFRASAGEIEELDGVWLTKRGTMRNVIENSSTVLTVLEMMPNAKINDSHFSERALVSKGR